ncbi:MAG: capsid protein [Circoviridae sp.]|nr:MAG: capsid protein [Circoviridae sp.]
MWYGKKKRTRRSLKKKTFKRRRYTKIPRKVNQNHMSVCLRTPDTLVSNNNLSEQYETYRFGLSNCLNYTAYVAMWDQYMIEKIVITWRPIRTQAVVSQNEAVAPSSFTNIPSVVYARDHDDLSPVTYADTKTRYGAVEKLATKGHAMKVYPATLTEIYKSPVTTGYSPQFKTWLDTADATIPHYGVRLAMEQAEPLGQYTLECKTKVYVRFKNRVI